MNAVILVLVCTLVGWLVGHPLLGLIVGLVLAALSTWAWSRPH